MSGCVVCTSLLRGYIDSALIVKRQVMKLGDVGESFDSIAARIEAHRREWYPNSSRVTADDIQYHFEQKHTAHPNLPVVQDYLPTPRPDETQPLTVADKVRAVLEGTIGIGLYNLRANPDKVTPDIMMRALRMLIELEQKDGKGTPWWAELSRMVEAKTIPAESPLGKAPRPKLEEEELAPLQTDAASSA